MSHLMRQQILGFRITDLRMKLSRNLMKHQMLSKKKLKSTKLMQMLLERKTRLEKKLKKLKTMDIFEGNPEIKMML